MHKRAITMTSYAARCCTNVRVVMEEVAFMLLFLNVCVMEAIKLMSRCWGGEERRKRKKNWLFWPFAGLWLQSQYRSLCGWVDGARSGMSVVSTLLEKKGSMYVAKGSLLNCKGPFMQKKWW